MINITGFNPFKQTINKYKPSIYFEEKYENKLFPSIIMSTIIHILCGVLAFYFMKILMIIFLYLGFDLSLFNKPIIKIRDIEFVLVQPDKKYQQKQIKKIKTNKAAKDHLAGPKPDKKVYTGDLGGLKSKTKNKKQDKEIFNKKFEVVNKNPVKQTAKAHTQAPIPLSKLPKQGTPKQIEKTVPDAFDIPMPKMKPLSSKTGYGTTGNTGYTSPTAGKASILGTGEGAGGSGESDVIGTGKRKGGGGYYQGVPGAPKPSAANSYSNEIGDVDLRPYVTELQRKIIRNWSTPQNNDNKKTVLFLRISKSGSLMIMNMKASSGDPTIDNAAMNAVRKSAPFNPLPANYKGSYADVIFTFDYNVSGRQN